MISCHHSIMISCHHSIMTSCNHSTVLWYPVIIVLWYPVIIVLLYPVIIVLWYPVIIAHHWLCGPIRPSKSYFFRMHKTSTNNDHMFVISSQIDSKYSELFKYVFVGPRTCHFSCVHTIISAEGSLVGCRMAGAKCMKKRCVKFMWQNIYLTHFFGLFCIIMDNPCVKNAKQIF
jgi:hypothetical protein